MGTAPDAESEAFQSPGADGDDNNGSDDEDGLVDPVGDLNLLVGETPTVDVQVTNNSGAASTLYGWIDYNGDGLFDNAIERALVAVADGSTDATLTLTFPVVPAGFVGDTYARFRLSTDAAAADPTGAVGDGEVEDYAAQIHAQVIVGSRRIFYDESYWDGGIAGANTTGGPEDNGDDGAIATGKSALLPGGTATSANWTSYDKGINGIMVDVAGLADPVAIDTSDDTGTVGSYFRFTYGNDNQPYGADGVPGGGDDWPAAALPSGVAVRAHPTLIGVYRITLTWAPGETIPTRNWLQATVLSGAGTGLAQDDVFYFGNCIGDANLDRSTLYDDIFAIYSNVDFVNLKPIIQPCDVNRDGKVLYDDIFACYSKIDFAGSLAELAPPAPPSAPKSGSGAPASTELLWAAHLAALGEPDRSSDDSEEEDPETPADAVFAAYADW
jgi:hypothetical protein